MPRPSLDELVKSIKLGMTRSEVLSGTGITDSGAFNRRWQEAVKLSGVIPATAPRSSAKSAQELNAVARFNEYMKPLARKRFSLQEGVILVGSDAHYWPGIISTAHRAFLKMCRELKPHAVVLNGDVFDGASANRHARIGWQHRPTVVEELRTCQERLTEIEDSLHIKQLFWLLGNHDANFETKVANLLPEFEGVPGLQLKHHFPAWQPGWSLWINDNTVIKHRFGKGGVHAAYNSTLHSGKSSIMGHLHSAKVTPKSDYNGTRYGVDAGCLAQPYGEQFTDYTEDNAVDWRSAFCVLTYWKGMLLWPELCHVIGEDKGLCQFRGTVFEV